MRASTELSRMSSTEPLAEVRQAIFAEAEDMGEAVRLLLERALRQGSGQARPEPPQPPSLTILDVYRPFEEIAAATGPGSRKRKEELLRGLLLRGTPVEAKYIVKDVLAEMRHGVGEGIVLEAIAQAARVQPQLVRRTNMLWGDLGEAALVALTEGEAVLKQATVRLCRPLEPMPAQTAEDLTEAFERCEGRVALEHKVDGARVQIHKRGAEVKIYSRQLSDVTASLPDAVEEIKGLETSERRLSNRRCIEIKRAGLAECPAWLRYGSPLRYEPALRRAPGPLAQGQRAQGIAQPALPRKLNDPGVGRRWTLDRLSLSPWGMRQGWGRKSCLRPCLLKRCTPSAGLWSWEMRASWPGPGRCWGSVWTCTPSPT